MCKLSGVGLLLVLAFWHGPAPLVVPVYLLRTWLMNAPQALTKSVLNDYVPKRHRHAA